MPFGLCPRCRQFGYERLRTYAHCVNCNYSPELERASSRRNFDRFEEVAGPAIEEHPPSRSHGELTKLLTEET